MATELKYTEYTRHTEYTKYLQWCCQCQGRRIVPNKYHKPMRCGTCAGTGFTKICPKCSSIMFSFQDICLKCILNSIPDLSNDIDFEGETFV